ncbi:MAG: hypothetical protein ACOYB3_14740 [Azonexus sp.]
MSRFQLPGADKDLPPQVNPDTLREFAAGAKDHRTDQLPAPWDAFDPKANPKHNVSVRLNEYQLAMLRYLSERTDVSQQKVLNRILIPALEKQAKELSAV